LNDIWAWRESRDIPSTFAVIACDKREAFAQGSEADEAIQLFRHISGLLRGAGHLARIRATRWLAMTIDDVVRRAGQSS
jgi:hypothetical protein